MKYVYYADLLFKLLFVCGVVIPISMNNHEYIVFRTSYDRDPAGRNLTEMEQTYYVSFNCFNT